MASISFRTRLLLSFVAVLALALSLALWHFNRTVGNDILTETKARAVENLDAVAWLLAEHPGFPGGESLDRFVSELGAKLGVRITYIDQGRVVADSQVPFAGVPGMDDHSTRPEVVEAGEGHLGMSIRHSDTLGKDLIYAARQVKAASNLRAGILRVAIPLSAVSQRLAQLKKDVALIALAAFALAGLLSLLLSRAMAGSLSAMAETAQAIGNGDYSRRMRYYPGKEFEPLAMAVNQMAANIDDHISMVEDQKGRLEAMFNGMAEGVMVLDNQGRIQSVNQALETMFPEAGGSIGRKPLEATMLPELQHAATRMLEDSGESGPERVLLELLGDRYLEANLVPFRDPHGGGRMVIVFHDVTEIRRTEKIRRDFTANVSHELKTPLTSIKGYAETLLDAEPPLEGQARNFLEVILKNADHMTAMVEELLVLAKTEHHQGRSPLKPVDAVRAVELAVQDLRHRAEDKQVELSQDIPEDLPLAMAHPDALVQVLRNLLDNALRHSPRGGVVAVRARALENSLEFSVTDQGPGIPQAQRDRVFERFFRIAPQNDKSGGAGLGLAICRHHIRNMKGRIWMQDPPEPPGISVCFSLCRAAP